MKLKNVKFHCSSLARAPSRALRAERSISELSVTKNNWIGKTELSFFSVYTVESDVTDCCHVNGRSERKHPQTKIKKKIVL